MVEAVAFTAEERDGIASARLGKGEEFVSVRRFRIHHAQHLDIGGKGVVTDAIEVADDDMGLDARIQQSQRARVGSQDELSAARPGL